MASVGVMVHNIILKLEKKVGFEANVRKKNELKEKNGQRKKEKNIMSVKSSAHVCDDVDL